jgi:hypothetical protein
MKLEAQIEQLAALGLSLEPGVTLDDLLYSCDRHEYEAKPFDTLLFMLGVEIEREPWGRPFCKRAWNFDTECIEDDGAYVDIVQHLTAVASAESRVSDVRGHVDHEAQQAWLEYTIDGHRRRLEPKVDTDWADADAVLEIMGDLERGGGGRRFYAKDNGQAQVLFFLDEATACRLNELTGGALSRARSAREGWLTEMSRSFTSWLRR